MNGETGNQYNIIDSNKFRMCKVKTILFSIEIKKKKNVLHNLRKYSKTVQYIKNASILINIFHMVPT